MQTPAPEWNIHLPNHDAGETATAGGGMLLPYRHAHAHTSDSGSNTEKPRAPPDPKSQEVATNNPNYFWLKTTKEDTESNKPTRNAMGNQLQQGQVRQPPNNTTSGL